MEKVPLLIAHRGESFDAPENTLAAFRLAWERGARAIELDVHLTADGQLLTMHDADTQRTGGVARRIAEHPAEALRQVDVGAWKGERWRGETAPRLAEVLALTPRGDATVFIEVKVGVEAIDELVRVVEASGLRGEQVVVISFKPETCAAAKRRLPGGCRVSYLSDFTQDEGTLQWSPTAEELIAQAKEAGLDGLDVAAKPCVDARFVAKVKAAGLRLDVWRVYDPRRARELAGLGVDGITTNRAGWLGGQLMWQSHSGIGRGKFLTRPWCTG